MPAHVKLMRITFQQLFPPTNVATVRLADCRRVVLFHYDKESETVEMRHYAIRATPSSGLVPCPSAAAAASEARRRRRRLLAEGVRHCEATR